MATRGQRAKIAESYDNLMDQSVHVGGWSNVNRETSGSLYWSSIDLYRHPRRGFFLRQTGGGAMRIDARCKWINGQDAREFLRDHAVDGHTGFGYSAAEVERLLIGESVRPEGHRDGPEPTRPDWAGLGSSGEEAPQYGMNDG